MANYDLDALGDTEFEHLCQTLLKEVIGSGTTTFGVGPDGGREATFYGRAPYPSSAEQWDGHWVFQAKFHDTRRLGLDKARSQVVEDLDSELDKITSKYKRPCDNYILITNVPLTPFPEKGTLDRIDAHIKPKYQHAVQHIHVWAADDVNRLLDRYSDIRAAYLHFLTPGDVLHLLAGAPGELSKLVSLSEGIVRNIARPTLFWASGKVELRDLVWRRDSVTPPGLDSVRSAAPTATEDPDAFVVEQPEVRQVLTKLRAQLGNGIRPRLVLVGHPMVGKSFFLYSLARAWVEEGSPIAFSCGELLATPEHERLRALPDCLVLVDQYPDAPPSQAMLSELGRTAAVVVVARRPGQSSVADQVFDTAFIPDYLSEERLEAAVTAYIPPANLDFVAQVVRVTASRYDLPISDEAVTEIAQLISGAGPIAGELQPILGLVKAFVLAAREMALRTERREPLQPEDVRGITRDLLRSARDHRASAQALLGRLFGGLPESVRRLLLVLRFLKDAFGGRANAYLDGTLRAACRIYYGAELDEAALQEAIELGIVYVYRAEGEDSALYTIWHLWQLEVMLPLPDRRYSELLDALASELGSDAALAKPGAEKAALLYDLAYLRWRHTDPARRAEAIHLYLESCTSPRSRIGQRAMAELVNHATDYVLSAHSTETSFQRLDELVSYIDIGSATGYEALANLLSWLRVLMEHAPAQGVGRDTWATRIEAAAQASLGLVASEGRWVAAYRTKTLIGPKSLSMDFDQEADLVHRLATYYREHDTSPEYALATSAAVVYCISDADHEPGRSSLRYAERLHAIVFWGLTGEEQSLYYANATYMLAQMHLHSGLPEGALHYWSLLFVEGFAKAGLSRPWAHHVYCLSKLDEFCRNAPGELASVLEVVDRLQAHVWSTAQETIHYYARVLAIEAYHVSRGVPESTLQVYLQFVAQRLIPLDSAVRQQLNELDPGRLIPRNHLVNCLALAAADMANPNVNPTVPLEQREAAVRLLLEAVVPQLREHQLELFMFLSLATDGALEGLTDKDITTRWLIWFANIATSELVGLAYKSRDWRKNPLAEYYGRLIGRTVMEDPESDSVLDAVLDHMLKASAPEHAAKLVIESISRSLDYISLQLLNPAGARAHVMDPKAPIRRVLAALQRAASLLRIGDENILRVLAASAFVYTYLNALVNIGEVERVIDAFEEAFGELIPTDERWLKLRLRALCEADSERSMVLAESLWRQSRLAGGAAPEEVPPLVDVLAQESYEPFARSLLELCDVIESDFVEVYVRSKPTFSRGALVAAAEARVERIAQLLGTVEPRTAQVESFEAAVRAYLGEWQTSAARLADALVTGKPALITERSTAWTTRREELLGEIWRKAPEVLGIPMLEQVIDTSIASGASIGSGDQHPGCSQWRSRIRVRRWYSA